eukprot:2901724-Amphidinium_carterae.1
MKYEQIVKYEQSRRIGVSRVIRQNRMCMVAVATSTSGMHRHQLLSSRTRISPQTAPLMTSKPSSVGWFCYVASVSSPFQANCVSPADMSSLVSVPNTQADSSELESAQEY